MISDSIKLIKSKNDKFIYYCEILLSIFYQTIKKYNYLSNLNFEQSSNDILKIINYDLDKMNLGQKSIEIDKMGKIVIIIPKDELLDQILKDNKDINVNDYLIEYKSSHNDGNVKRKEELLRLLSNHIEGITKDKNLKVVYKRLYENTDFLYNNLDLRHNVEVKDRRFYEKTLNNREKWLDMTYRQSLLVIATRTEQKDSALISKLKNEVEEGK